MTLAFESRASCTTGGVRLKRKISYNMSVGTTMHTNSFVRRISFPGLGTGASFSRWLVLIISDSCLRVSGYLIEGQPT